MNVIRTTIVCLALCAGAARAGEPAADPAKAQYDAERASCLSGTTGQDQVSCLRSAGAAYELVKQNRLRDPNTAYHDNALARCANLPPSDRPDCVARVDGEGYRSGSVQGGGIITETVTTIPAPQTR